MICDTNPPNINKWHEKFGYLADTYAEEGGHLIPIARRVAC